MTNPQPQPPASPLGAFDLSAAVQELRRQGLTVQDIARMLGVHQRVIIGAQRKGETKRLRLT